jgi:hypothetical protein
MWLGQLLNESDSIVSFPVTGVTSKFWQAFEDLKVPARSFRLLGNHLSLLSLAGRQAVSLSRTGDRLMASDLECMQINLPFRPLYHRRVNLVVAD